MDFFCVALTFLVDWLDLFGFVDVFDSDLFVLADSDRHIRLFRPVFVDSSIIFFGVFVVSVDVVVLFGVVVTVRRRLGPRGVPIRSDSSREDRLRFPLPFCSLLRDSISFEIRMKTIENLSKT